MAEPTVVAEAPLAEFARRTLRPTLTAVAVVTVVVLAFLGITLQTGFPGPGPVRRYPRADLEALADKINNGPKVMGPCDAVPTSPRVHVDWVRARVAIDSFGPLSEPLAPSEQAMLSSPLFMRVPCEQA